MTRRLLVLFNPTAGRRRRARLDQALARLRQAGCELHLHETTGPGDAEEVAAGTLRDDWHAVVAAGGDGTVNEVVNGLVRSPAPPALAVLPLGTANVLACEIGLHDPVAAILRGSERRIHLGLCEGRHFVLMAGAGLDAHVVAGVGAALKRAGGKLAYAAEAVRQALRYGFPPIPVAIDGQVHSARAVLVCKAGLYGGNHLVAPEADLCEPCFSVLLLDGQGWRAALRYGLALLRGRLAEQPDVVSVKARQVFIEGPEGSPVQADGDIVANLPVEIVISPHSLRLLTP